MANKSKRLNILSDDECKALYNRPTFSTLEREHFFSLSKPEWKLIEKLNFDNSVYFILQMGYFQAKSQFFNVTTKNTADDIKFITEKVLSRQKTVVNFPSRNSQRKMKNMILSFLQYVDSVSTAKSECKERLKTVLQRLHNPSEIFKELLHFLSQKRIMLPAYTTMQEIISNAIVAEENRLKNKVQEGLPKHIKKDLLSLLTIDGDFYKLTDLKHDLRNFNYGQITDEVTKHNAYKKLYYFSKKFIPLLEISIGKINYYASLATYYTVYKLKRMPETLANLYMLCYVFHRHQKMSDNLTQAFNFKVDNYDSDASTEADKVILAEKKQLNIDDEKMGVLIGYYTEEPLFDWTFRNVAEKAYETLPKEEIDKLKRHYSKKGNYKEQLIWEYYIKIQRTITRNIRPIFKALHINCDQENNAVFKAAQFMQSLFLRDKTLEDVKQDDIPRKIISKQVEPYIIKDGKIDLFKYEFLVYLKLRKCIGNHKIYLNDTVQFKSFQEDIKATADWEKNRDVIIEKLNNPKLSGDIEKRLVEKQAELEALYVTVNNNINSGENTFVNVVEKNGEKTWTLTYPTDIEEFDHKYYRNLGVVDISDAFDLVNEKCNFMSAVKHIKERESKGEMDYQGSKACIIANGTRQGIDKMATRCNLNLQELQTSHANYIRVETIDDACTILTKKIAKLPFFKKYNFLPGINHASIDGSKQGSKRQTAKCRFSPKYFGLTKGVSALSMILHGAPLNTKIIGANEHESHFSFDIYFNNKSDIPIDMISTDTAGSNQLTHLFYDLVNVEYAPCYKSVVDTMINNLCGFNDLNHYKDMLIKPKIKTKMQLIIDESDNMKQVFAAVLMKETTQHVVMKKLSCRDNANKLKRAMWEYNRVFFSIYMLKYIDDPLLQRAVRIVLNTGENYNKLYNGVTKIGGKKFRGMSDIEIDIWHQCTRLITLVILYYNIYLLSTLIEQMGDDEEAIKLIMRVSPLALRHINLGGLYYYGNDNKKIDVEGMVAAMKRALEELREKKKKP